ncbi:MAG: hypothetical protein EBS69_03545 [Verrucomicrobia bacterium]|nr:hypothetical protein [Verrucomicrobiota bacterium]
MPRKPRHCPPGQVVHVCNRAVNRSQMFFCEFDYREVIKVLAEAIQKYPVDLFAYCLMPNHWHLLLRGRKTHAISKMLHWFSTKQSVRWRKMTQTTGAGAVYQNRFRSHLVIGGDAFLAVARYIERNPVSANLIRSPLHLKGGQSISNNKLTRKRFAKSISPRGRVSHLAMRRNVKV